MKTKTLFILLLFLIISCTKNEPQKETAIQLNDHIVDAGTKWLMELALKNGFAKKLKGTDSTLHITVRITESDLAILRDDSTELAKAHYWEFHRYIAEDDSADMMIRYYYSDPKQPKHPRTERQLKHSERKGVFLYVLDPNDSNTIVKSHYHPDFTMLFINSQGEFETQLIPGDTLYGISNAQIMILGPCLITDTKETHPVTVNSKVIEFSIDDIDRCPVSLYYFVDFHLYQIIAAYVFLNRESVSKIDQPKYQVTLEVAPGVTDEVKEDIVDCLKVKEFVEVVNY